MSDIITEFGDIINHQARSVGRKFLPLIKSRVDMDDLINEAALVALEKRPEYDPSRDPDVTRFIGVQIRYGLMQYVAKNIYDLNVPFGAMYAANKRNDKEFIKNNTAIRIGVKNTEEDAVLPEEILPHASGTNTLDEMERDEDIEILLSEIQKLNKDEKFVITERFLSDEEHSRVDISEKLNYHYISIGQIEQRAKEKLRIRIKNKHGTE